MSIIVFAFGLIFGSFFNVCIYRIPRGESIAYPSSHCTSCNKELKWYDLVPVLSYILLKGRCRSCGEKISIIYPLIEIISGIVYLIIYIKFGITFKGIKYVFLFSILLISSVIDLNTSEVYFNVSLAGFIGGLVFSLLDIINGQELSYKIISILIPLLIIGGIFLMSKFCNGFGAGDLEVFLFISLYLTPKLMILSIFLSVIIGGILAFILIIKGDRKKYIPFVPFIAIGTFLSVTIGEYILNLYLSLII